MLGCGAPAGLAHQLPPVRPSAAVSPLAVWGYLRTSLTCAARQDLLAAVDAEDLPALQRELPLE